MKINVILALCLLVAVIHTARCFSVLEPKNVEEQDDPTANDEAGHVREKRGQCCNFFNTKCCCKVNGQQCIVTGWSSTSCGSATKDCEGCKLGWKC